jgi:hypothetical protein
MLNGVPLAGPLSIGPARTRHWNDPRWRYGYQYGEVFSSTHWAKLRKCGQRTEKFGEDDTVRRLSMSLMLHPQ